MIIFRKSDIYGSNGNRSRGVHVDEIAFLLGVFVELMDKE